MSKIKTSILLFLSQNYDWITAKSISSNTGISVRSVKYQISLINEEYSDAILSSNKGYKINRDNYNDIINIFFTNNKLLTYYDRKNIFFVSYLFLILNFILMI